VAEVTPRRPANSMWCQASFLKPDTRSLKPEERGGRFPVRFSGHPHGGRQQFDNPVTENASSRGLEALSFEVGF